VDLGCGSGLWAERLVRAGYRVVGIDASPAMVALARRRVPKAVFRRTTVARAALPPCQAVTAFGEVLNYAPAPSLASIVARVRRALQPGGLFLFDVREPAAAAVPARSVHAIGRDWVVMAHVRERGRALTREIVTFRRTGAIWRRTNEVHRLRLFTREEVARALLAAGFSVGVRSGWGRTPLGDRRAAFVARRAYR
jgi:SAM-dependent methyltransferase